MASSSSSDSEDETRFNDDEDDEEGEEGNATANGSSASSSSKRGPGPGSSGGLSLMGLVFGNIDGQGQLTGSDVLDADSSAKLAGLEQLLGGRGAAELMEDDHDQDPTATTGVTK